MLPQPVARRAQGQAGGGWTGGRLTPFASVLPVGPGPVMIPSLKTVQMPRC